MCLAYPNLIAPSCFCEVTYPFDAVVIALLKDLEEPDEQPRRRKHQDLEIDVDWRSRPWYAIGGSRQVTHSC